MQRLYEQGARAFWIHNTGPIGCLPLATMLYGQNRQPGFYDKYGCITTHNAMAVEFNKQLKARVASLRAQLPRAAFIYVDIYSAKYHLITNSKSYGQYVVYFISIHFFSCKIYNRNFNRIQGPFEDLLWSSHEKRSCGLRGEGCDQRLHGFRWGPRVSDGVHKLGWGPLFAGCESLDC